EQLRVLERERPHTVLRPQDNTYGMVLFSRLELVEPRVEFLVEDDVPSFHLRVRLPFGREVELHCLHPRPPAPGENPRSTERDAELLVVGKAVKEARLPVIVAGDLNDVAWSHTTRLFQKVSGLLDPRIGRGFFNTFHARIPLVRWPLDHLFHSRHFRLLALERGRAYGSDHFPVYVALSYESDAQDHHDEPEADSGERREAEEKIADAVEEEGKSPGQAESEARVDGGG
ncbi:MAG TPA: endonuclease/exonuclease/phosphatase family protein, partial [Longimicrobiaceae bacterium]|nr:endonuclease/exonuclease/phosphatase family protein [Longimicrobiaceae bacterium]